MTSPSLRVTRSRVSCADTPLRLVRERMIVCWFSWTTSRITGLGVCVAPAKEDCNSCSRLVLIIAARSAAVKLPKFLTLNKTRPSSTTGASAALLDGGVCAELGTDTKVSSSVSTPSNTTVQPRWTRLGGCPRTIECGSRLLPSPRQNRRVTALRTKGETVKDVCLEEAIW